MIIKGKDLDKVSSATGGILFANENGNISINTNGKVSVLNIPDELIDKYIAERDKKYYLHVLPNEYGYFERVYEDNSYIIDDFSLPDECQQKFTQSEVDELCKKFPYIDFWAVAEKVGEE